MIKLNNTTIGSAYLGSTPISKIYKGNDLIYQKQKAYIEVMSQQPYFLYYLNGADERTLLNPFPMYSLQKIYFDEPIISMRNMFNGNPTLASLNINNLDISEVRDMSYAFANTTIRSLYIDKLDTSKVTNMSYMFYRGLDRDRFVISLDTSNVTDMSYMFNGALVSYLDVSSFDISKVTKMDCMFGSNIYLQHITCKQSFKDWCMANQDIITLPTNMREGGSGVWEIVK